MDNPLTRNLFIVNWGGSRNTCAEVNGLATAIKAADPRTGSAPADDSSRTGNVTHPRLVLSRGLLHNDSEFFDWMNASLGGTLSRRNVQVILLDPTSIPAVQWYFSNAYPVKLEYTSLESTNSGMMMETLELDYDTMTVTYGLT
jgi:phage tail-like protein